MVKRTWAAEIEMDAARAGKLIAAQFPALAGASIDAAGYGWDNVAFVVAGHLVFRFPRREIAAPLIAREAAVLPAIAAALPLAVPVPTFVGVPSDDYPWPFAGYERLAGDPASAVAWSEEARTACAAPLGAFLRVLHGIDVAPFRAHGLPGDEIGRLDHALRMPAARGRLEELAAAGLVRSGAACLAALERDAPAATRSQPALVHGDLYARHLLLDAAQRVCGVIDWGDVHAGDPAIDIAVAWLVLPSAAHALFRAAYGGVDETTWRIARYRALYHALMCAHYGAIEGVPDMLALGMRAIREIVPDAER